MKSTWGGQPQKAESTFGTTRSVPASIIAGSPNSSKGISAPTSTSLRSPSPASTAGVAKSTSQQPSKQGLSSATARNNAQGHGVHASGGIVPSEAPVSADVSGNSSPFHSEHTLGMEHSGSSISKVKGFGLSTSSGSKKDDKLGSHSSRKQANAASQGAPKFGPAGRSTNKNARTPYPAGAPQNGPKAPGSRPGMN